MSLHKCFNKNFKSDPSQRGATWFYEENPLYFYTKGILTKKREEEILPSTDVDNAEEEEKEDGEGEEEGEDDDDEEGEVTSTLAVVPNEGRGAGDGTEEGGGKSRGRSSRKRKGAAERSESEKSPKTPRNGSGNQPPRASWLPWKAGHRRSSISPGSPPSWRTDGSTAR